MIPSNARQSLIPTDGNTDVLAPAAVIQHQLPAQPHQQQASRRRPSPVGNRQRKARRGQPYEKPVNSATSLLISNTAADLVRKTSRGIGKSGVDENKEPANVLFEEISKLLKAEKAFPRNPMLLYHEDQSVDENIDGAMRDEEVLNLRFLQGYFNLLPETFARALSIIDHFILKVRVKPKYMSCVATAAYYMAVMIHEEPKDRPSKEELVTLTRCGGTPEDLRRMVDIIQTKLTDELVNASTAVDFAKALMKKCAKTYNNERLLRIFSRILVGMASLYVYQFPIPTVALASFLLEATPSEAAEWLENGEMFAIAQFCGISMVSVKLCAEYLQNMYSLFYQRSLPSSRDRLTWCLSRRTRSKLSSVRSTHLDEKLYPIVESNESELSDG